MDKTVPQLSGSGSLALSIALFEPSSNCMDRPQSVTVFQVEEHMHFACRVVHSSSSKPEIEVTAGKGDECVTLRLAPLVARRLEVELSAVLDDVGVARLALPGIWMGPEDWRDLYEALWARRMALDEGEFDLVEPDHARRLKWADRLDRCLARMGVDGRVALFAGTRPARPRGWQQQAATGAGLNTRRSSASNAGGKWSAEEDRKLCDAFQDGRSVASLALEHGRTRGAIQARLEKLGLVQARPPSPPRLSI
jgi:hypothetical protein